MRLLCVILFLTLSASAIAGTKQIEQVDRQIMDYIFNAQWQKADSIIESKIKEYPNHPKYYYMKAPLYFYTRYFAQGQMPNDSLRQLVEDYALKAIEIGEELEESTEVKFYLGASYGFLSRVQVMKREYWDGFWSADECEDYLEEVLEEDPEFYDAYVALGVMEYYPTVVNNSWVRAFAFLVGMSGDRETGMKYFERTYNKGSLCKNEAHFILATLNRFTENDLDKGYQYFNSLHQEFPDNPFVEQQLNTTKFAKLIADEGTGFLEKEFDVLKEKYQIANSGVLNAIGYYYIGQEKLDIALAVFKTNIKLYPDEANPYDSLAECFVNMGDNQNAIKYYKIAYGKLDTDPQINDAFRERLRTGIEERLDDLGADVSS